MFCGMPIPPEHNIQSMVLCNNQFLLHQMLISSGCEARYTDYEKRVRVDIINRASRVTCIEALKSNFIFPWNSKDLVYPAYTI